MLRNKLVLRYFDLFDPLDEFSKNSKGFEEMRKSTPDAAQFILFVN